MADEMVKFGLDEPEFSEGNDSFKVVFRNKGNLISPNLENTVNLKDEGLNSRQIDVLTKIINDNEILTYEDYMELFDVSRATAERDFSILLKKGFVKRSIKNRIVYFSSSD